MADISGFNPNAHEPLNDFDAIPAGDYLAIISDSEYKATKDGQGKMLVFTFEIVDGKYKGRKLWSRLNLQNRNETAVKIAQSELADICRAIKVMQPKDSIELHNLPLVIKVKCKKRKDTDEMQNEIKGYANKSEQAKSPAAPTASGDTSAPPWKR